MKTGSLFYCKIRIFAVNILYNISTYMENKYITVAYKLYAINNGEKELLEEAPAEHPFQFISGIGYTLDRFEKEILSLNKGDLFNFTIPCAEAYGERDEDNVKKVPKSVFCGPDGEFDSDNVYEGNIIMLNDGEGHQFYANVGEISDDKVVLDLNHPHAGKDLTFEGSVIEMRDATNKEIEDLVKEISGGCGGGCEGCGGGCGDHECGEGHHGDNCHGNGCGHCH